MKAYESTMIIASPDILDGVTDREYNRRIRAWTMYDWANSAFATTILSAVLPVYFSKVAGATLPSPTVATTYWSYGLSFSLLVVAVLSPILGTVSDVMQGKKRFLAVFAGIGIISTALLVLVERGDWVLASVLGIVGRIGFSGANTFYDALLPHVAREEDRDRVSARGYAIGYLGGGLLLAINILMIQSLPGTWGARLSFLSVAIWWAAFSIPIFLRVPEPPSAAAKLKHGESVVSASLDRLCQTLKDIRRYRELFKYLLAFLVYNDGIGTVIGIAAIYGAELGLGSVDMILALLLVQFVGIPYSLIFGRLSGQGERRRPIYLAFVLFNMAFLPLFGIIAASILPADISGARLMAAGQMEALPGSRQADLAVILGIILIVVLMGLAFSCLLGRALFSRLAEKMDAKRSIVLALAVYVMITIWGYFLDSVVEFWFLAWMVAVVQGGSQALSRSLYAAMSPTAKSGEFFGLFGVMEKFSTIVGPLLFASAGIIFGSSRPAILSLIALFLLGGFLLLRVNVDEGKRVAQREDAVFLKNAHLWTND